MKENNILNKILFAIILLLLQILIFNNVLFFRSFNPYIYILFIMVYPINQNQNYLLLWAFGIGFILDYFSYTGGIHAFASVFLAFIRPSIIRFLSGKTNMDFESFSFYDFNFFQTFLFVILCVFSHHLVLFLIENFKFSGLLSVSLNILYSMLLSSALIFIFYGLRFRNRNIT